MNQSKYIEEIEELNVADVSQNERLRKKQNNRKKIKSVLIVILSVLCVTGIVLIQKLHNDASIHPEQRIRFSRMATQKLPSLSAVSDSLSSVVGLEKSDTLSDKPISVDLRKDVEVSDKIPVAQITAPGSSDSADEVLNQPTPKTDYTMNDALIFKEHFIRGDSCTIDYQQLMQTTHKTIQMQTVLNDLMPYCSNKSTMLKSLRHAFLKDKKRALIAQYREKEPFWIAYPKALLVSVIEIRKLNPATTRPKDILYKAQNELYRNNVAQAEKLVRMLPPVMQEAMTDFLREADLYMRADKSLSALVLSFSQEGE